MGASFRPASIVTKIFANRSAIVALFAAAVLCCLGCGQGGGSSGGEVLGASGFFSQIGLTPSYTPDTGNTVSLSSTISIPGAGSNSGFIGLENLQGTAPIVTSAANLTYAIPGSSFTVPSDVFPFSINLPPAKSSGPTEVFAQLQLVSPARMDFLRANTGFLPPLPFQMTISVTVAGQSPAGDTFYSNPVSYNVTFTD